MKKSIRKKLSAIAVKLPERVSIAKWPGRKGNVRVPPTEGRAGDVKVNHLRRLKRMYLKGGMEFVNMYIHQVLKGTVKY